MYEYLDPPLEFDEKICLANVPYYFLDAKEYFLKLWENKKISSNLVEQILTRPETIITLERSELIKQDSIFLEKKKEKMGCQILNMDDIEDEPLIEEDLKWLENMEKNNEY